MASQDPELNVLVRALIPHKDLFNLTIDAVVLSFIFRLFTAVSIGVSVIGFWKALFAGAVYVAFHEIGTRVIFKRGLEWFTRADQWAPMRLMIGLPLLGIILPILIFLIGLLSLMLTAGFTSLTITGYLGSLLVLLAVRIARNQTHKYWERTGGQALTNWARRVQEREQKS